MSSNENSSNIEVLNTKVDMTYRQKPLCAHYAEHPEEAQITDWAQTNGASDPVHGTINLGRSIGGATIPQDYLPEDTSGDETYDVEWPVGIHKAVGGDHDLPNPGNILAAALATCLDSTIRIIANRMNLPLKNLQVTVASHADVRGTLVVDREVPVKFQKMECTIEIEPAEEVNPKLLKKLHKAVEYSCVNLQTLRNGTDVRTKLDIK
ncbi:MAG: OsmC family protein [Bacteroidota bacterium]